MEYTINHIAYNIETSGTGPQQALLLHYFGGSGASWAEVMRRVPEIRCIAPDLAGFGATPVPDVAYTVDQHAADMLALIAALELDDFALVGHSMGGKVALALAALQPAGLRELILVAPSPPTPEPMTDADRARLRAAHGDPAAIVAQITTVAGHTLAANLYDSAVQENLRTSLGAWQAWLDEGSRENISAQLAQITVPVTILGGELDPVIPPALIASELTPYFTGTSARVSIIPEIGHLIPYEAPQRIVDALIDARRG